jgi:putative transposase
MDDYNHFRPHDTLGEMSPINYAKINSNGASSIRIKNNKFDNSRKLNSSN